MKNSEVYGGLWIRTNAEIGPIAIPTKPLYAANRAAGKNGQVVACQQQHGYWLVEHGGDDAVYHVSEFEELRL